jgi:hypothetical protein
MDAMRAEIDVQSILSNYFEKRGMWSNYFETHSQIPHHPSPQGAPPALEVGWMGTIMGLGGYVLKSFESRPRLSKSLEASFSNWAVFHFFKKSLDLERDARPQWSDVNEDEKY